MGLMLVAEQEHRPSHVGWTAISAQDTDGGGGGRKFFSSPPESSLSWSQDDCASVLVRPPSACSTRHRQAFILVPAGHVAFAVWQVHAPTAPE